MIRENLKYSNHSPFESLFARPAGCLSYQHTSICVLTIKTISFALLLFFTLPQLWPLKLFENNIYNNIFNSSVVYKTPVLWQDSRKLAES